MIVGNVDDRKPTDTPRTACDISLGTLDRAPGLRPSSSIFPSSRRNVIRPFALLPPDSARTRSIRPARGRAASRACAPAGRRGARVRPPGSACGGPPRRSRQIATHPASPAPRGTGPISPAAGSRGSRAGRRNAASASRSAAPMASCGSVGFSAVSPFTSHPPTGHHHTARADHLVSLKKTALE